MVVGGGIGGLAAAVALRRRGWQVTVCERAPSLEAVGAGIAVTANALRALDVIGVGAQVRNLAAMHGDAGIRTAGGRWLTRTNAELATARFGDPTVLLHRSVLIDVLAGALGPDGLRLGTLVDQVDPHAGRVRAGDVELSADLVVAADGIHSGIRRSLLPEHPGAVYSGMTSWRIVVPDPGRPVTSTESWGRGEIFGIATLADGRIYCYATATAPAGGSAPDERAELSRRFGRWHDPIPQLIASAGQVLRTDIWCLDQPLPRFHFGRVALLGDAAHAMTPNLGQGGCQAIEDAVVLAAIANADGGLAQYTAARLPRTTRIVRQSRRLGQATQLTNPLAVALRDSAMWLAGRLGPGVMLRPVQPVLGWRPPS